MTHEQYTWHLGRLSLSKNRCAISIARYCTFKEQNMPVILRKEIARGVLVVHPLVKFRYSQLYC